MSDDQQQPAATGQLTFATGGVISADQPPVVEPGPASFVMPHQLGTAPIRANGAPGQLPGAAAATVHTMPSGHTITFAPLESLTRRDRTALMELNDRLTAEDAGQRGRKVLDALLARIILAWTYPWPLPSQDLESLEQLPMTDVWDMEKVAKRADKLLFVGPVTPDDHADPASPTAPSGE